MDVKVLFRANPSRFKEAAKGKSYNEFISYLESQPNFKIMEFMSELDKRTLYDLAKEAQN